MRLVPSRPCCRVSLELSKYHSTSLHLSAPEEKDIDIVVIPKLFRKGIVLQLEVHERTSRDLGVQLVQELAPGDLDPGVEALRLVILDGCLDGAGDATPIAGSDRLAEVRLVEIIKSRFELLLELLVELDTDPEIIRLLCGRLFCFED